MLQFVDQLMKSFGLIDGDKGVNVCKFSPADGHQLGSGIQFHGTGPQGDHGVGQRQVAQFLPRLLAREVDDDLFGDFLGQAVGSAVKRLQWHGRIAVTIAGWNFPSNWSSW